MERYSNRKIDELGRIVLHGELREKLELESKDKIALTMVDTIVVLQRADSDCNEAYESEICELGRVTIPLEIRKAQFWDAGTKIAVYHTDSLVILKTL